MVTTREVRAVMRKYDSWYTIYTNKTTGDTSRRRRVKCYKPGDAKKADALLKELRELAGEENVTVYTPNVLRPWCNTHDSVVVKCELA